MIFRKYILGDIKNNKKHYTSTLVSIFLAVLILSTFIFALSSYFQEYRQIVKEHTGGYHFRITSELSSQETRSLLKNRHIKEVGLVSKGEIKNPDQESITLYKMNSPAFKTIASWLKEGELPKNNEILISNEFASSFQKKLGEEVKIEGAYYRIAGIFYDFTYEEEQLPTIFLQLANEELLEEDLQFSPFIWYKNIFRTYSLSEDLLASLGDKNAGFNYNRTYLDRSFVFYPGSNLLTDYSLQTASLVFLFILLLFFSSILKTLFSVQELKSIQEYSKLRILGAKTSDIKRIIRQKSLYLAQIPIFLGIIVAMVFLKSLYFFLNKIERHFSETSDLFLNLINFDIKSSLIYIIFIYLLTILIIYLASLGPIKIIKKTSILNGLKGKLPLKSFKKKDFQSRGNLEKDLARHFYQNSKKGFIFSQITLQIGFVLVAFVLLVSTYFSLDENLNRADPFSTYNIQVRYDSLNPIKEEMLASIEELELEEVLSFRQEFVYIDYEEKFIDEAYRNSPSLESLLKRIGHRDNLKLNLIGLDDHNFKRLLKERGLNPEEFKEGKVLLLNSLGDKFEQPLVKIKDLPFLKETTEKLSLSEYGDSFMFRGYEFELDVSNKIYQPLIDYPLSKYMLNAYMKKSDYLKLLDSFEKIGDIDQFEHLLLKSNNILKDKKAIKALSQEYFKQGSFKVHSELDQQELEKKRKLISYLLSFFFSLFFLLVGFANSYSSFYNLFLQRTKELQIYRAIGMDRALLNRILNLERKMILRRILLPLPLILIFLSFLVSLGSIEFGLLDILLGLNYSFILAYLLIIYLSLSKIYKNYAQKFIK